MSGFIKLLTRQKRFQNAQQFNLLGLSLFLELVKLILEDFLFTHIKIIHIFFLNNRFVFIK